MAWPEPSQPGVGHFNSWDLPGSGLPHPELKGKLQTDRLVRVVVDTETMRLQLQEVLVKKNYNMSE